MRFAFDRPVPLGLRRRLLRRAFVGPILAAPPVRAIHAWHIPKSKIEIERIVLKYEGKLVYKEKNFWLVLKRPSLAGFKAPNDIQIKRTDMWSPKNIVSFLDAGSSLA